MAAAWLGCVFVILHSFPSYTASSSSVKEAASYPVVKARGVVPQIAFVGPQTSGKSFLLNAFFQYPLAYASYSSGTRCPVEYKMVHDADRKDPLVKVAGKVVELTELENVIEQHMQRIYEGESYNENKLEVVIESEWLQDVDLFDLPGFSSDDDYKELVENLLAPYVRNPSMKIVLVAKMTDSWSTFSALSKLENIAYANTYPDKHLQPRTDWKQHTIVVGNWGSFLAPGKTTRQVHDIIDDYLTSSRKEGIDTLKFTLLVPPVEKQGVSELGSKVFAPVMYGLLNNEEKAAYLKDLIENEDTWWRDTRVRAEQLKEDWEQHHNDYIGFEKVRNMIKRLWSDIVDTDIVPTWPTASEKNKLKAALEEMRGQEL